MVSGSPQQIETILNNHQEVGHQQTLIELIRQSEDLISEIKRNNTLVLNYFKENEEVQMNLIELITVEGLDQTNTDRFLKFPLIASEIFESFSSHLLSSIFFTKFPRNFLRILKQQHLNSLSEKKNEEHSNLGENISQQDNILQDSQITSASSETNNESQFLGKDEGGKIEQREYLQLEYEFDLPQFNKLFNFIKVRTTLNEVLAGFWTKLVVCLMQIRPFQTISYILTAKGVLDSLLFHMDNTSIASVMQSLLIFESNKFSNSMEEENLILSSIKVNIIGQLLEKFEVYELDEIGHLGQIFSEIVSKYYLIQDGKDMLECLCGEISITRIFQLLTSLRIPARLGAANLILSLSQYYAFNANSFISGYPEGSEYYSIMLSEYESMPFFQQLIQNFEFLSRSLVVDSSQAVLGQFRLKIIEIIGQVMKILFPTVFEAICQTRIIEKVMELFFQFEWHNILHAQVAALIINVIQQSSEKTKWREYLNHLLVDLRLPSILIGKLGDGHYYFDGQKSDKFTTRGNLGFIIKIADALENFFFFSPLKDTHPELIEWRNSDWVEFTENVLDLHKEKGCRDLGKFEDFLNGISVETVKQSPEDEEEDMSIFQEYERQQAVEKMRSRQSYIDQVELAKLFELKKQTKLIQSLKRKSPVRKDLIKEQKTQDFEQQKQEINSQKNDLNVTIENFANYEEKSAEQEIIIDFKINSQNLQIEQKEKEQEIQQERIVPIDKSEQVQANENPQNSSIGNDKEFVDCALSLIEQQKINQLGQQDENPIIEDTFDEQKPSDNQNEDVLIIVKTDEEPQIYPMELNPAILPLEENLSSINSQLQEGEQYKIEEQNIELSPQMNNNLIDQQFAELGGDSNKADSKFEIKTTQNENEKEIYADNFESEIKKESLEIKTSLGDSNLISEQLSTITYQIEQPESDHIPLLFENSNKIPDKLNESILENQNSQIIINELEMKQMVSQQCLADQNTMGPGEEFQSEEKILTSTEINLTKQNDKPIMYQEGQNEIEDELDALIQEQLNKIRQDLFRNDEDPQLVENSNEKIELDTEEKIIDHHLQNEVEQQMRQQSVKMSDSEENDESQIHRQSIIQEEETPIISSNKEPLNIEEEKQISIHTFDSENIQKIELKQPSSPPSIKDLGLFRYESKYQSDPSLSLQIIPNIQDEQAQSSFKIADYNPIMINNKHIPLPSLNNLKMNHSSEENQSKPQEAELESTLISSDLINNKPSSAIQIQDILIQNSYIHQPKADPISFPSYIPDSNIPTIISTASDIQAPSSLSNTPFVMINHQVKYTPLSQQQSPLNKSISSTFEEYQFKKLSPPEQNYQFEKTIIFEDQPKESIQVNKFEQISTQINLVSLNPPVQSSVQESFETKLKQNVEKEFLKINENINLNQERINQQKEDSEKKKLQQIIPSVNQFEQINTQINLENLNPPVQSSVQESSENKLKQNAEKEFFKTNSDINLNSELINQKKEDQEQEKRQQTIPSLLSQITYEPLFKRNYSSLTPTSSNAYPQLSKNFSLNNEKIENKLDFTHQIESSLLEKQTKIKIPESILTKEQLIQKYVQNPVTSIQNSPSPSSFQIPLVNSTNLNIDNIIKSNQNSISSDKISNSNDFISSFSLFKQSDTMKSSDSQKNNQSDSHFYPFNQIEGIQKNEFLQQKPFVEPKWIDRQKFDTQKENNQVEKISHLIGETILKPKIDYSEKESSLLNAKLSLDVGYKDDMNQIEEFQKVFLVLNGNNIELIKEKYSFNSELRENFINAAQRSQLSLDQQLDSLDSDKFREEREMKIQFQIDYEVMERQIKMEPFQQEQELSDKLLEEHVQKLFNIKTKFCQKQKLLLEKNIIDAKQLNDQLRNKSIHKQKDHSINTFNQIHNLHSERNNLRPGTPNPNLIQMSETQNINQISTQISANSQETQVIDFEEKVEEEEVLSPCFGNVSKYKINHNDLNRRDESSPKFGSIRTSPKIQRDRLRVLETSIPLNMESNSNNNKKPFLEQKIQLDFIPPKKQDLQKEDPYDFKASSSARNKSPMPFQHHTYNQPTIVPIKDTNKPSFINISTSLLNKNQIRPPILDNHNFNNFFKNNHNINMNNNMNNNISNNMNNNMTNNNNISSINFNNDSNNTNNYNNIININNSNNSNNTDVKKNNSGNNLNNNGSIINLNSQFNRIGPQHQYTTSNSQMNSTQEYLNKITSNSSLLTQKPQSIEGVQKYEGIQKIDLSGAAQIAQVSTPVRELKNSSYLIKSRLTNNSIGGGRGDQSPICDYPLVNQQQFSNFENFQATPIPTKQIQIGTKSSQRNEDLSPNFLRPESQKQHIPSTMIYPKETYTPSNNLPTLKQENNYYQQAQDQQDLPKNRIQINDFKILAAHSNYQQASLTPIPEQQKDKYRLPPSIPIKQKGLNQDMNTGQKSFIPQYQKNSMFQADLLPHPTSHQKHQSAIIINEQNVIHPSHIQSKSGGQMEIEHFLQFQPFVQSVQNKQPSINYKQDYSTNQHVSQDTQNQFITFNKPLPLNSISTKSSMTNIYQNDKQTNVQQTGQEDAYQTQKFSNFSYSVPSTPKITDMTQKFPQQFKPEVQEMIRKYTSGKQLDITINGSDNNSMSTGSSSNQDTVFSNLKYQGYQFNSQYK